MREAKVSVHELEAQIEKIVYSGESLPKIVGAENAKLPAFIQVFYYLFFKNLEIPSENEFYQTYLKWLGGIKNGELIYENHNLDLIGVESRLKRTYPTLIRDLHFLYLLEASNKFDNVEYSMQMDYFNGLDLKIIYKGNVSFVSLFIDSSRGKYFKNKKTKRDDYSEINGVVFNVDFAKLSKVRNIFLLNQLHVDVLEERLKEK